MRQGAVLAFVALMLLAGCSKAAVETPPDANDLRPYLVGSGQLSFSGAPLRPPAYSVHLLDTQAAFDDVWFNKTSHDAAPEQPIPFDARTAVLVSIKGTPTAGWTIDVDNLTFAGGLYRIHASTTEPGETCVAAQVTAQVYAIVAFDRKLTVADDTKILPSRVHSVVEC